LPEHEFLGDEVRAKLIYYPTVTREPFRNRGRLTDLIDSNRLFDDLQITPFDAATDRAMVCGSPSMLSDTCRLLDALGFEISPNIGSPGDYVIERAFVEK
jgi:ferredoxin--NADP+ reductase